MRTAPTIIFLDFLENNQKSIQRTLAEVSDLYLQFDENNGLSPDLFHQLASDMQFLLNANVPVPPAPKGLTGLPTPKHDSPTVLDPMFNQLWDLVASASNVGLFPGIRDTLFKITGSFVKDAVDGKFPSQQGGSSDLTDPEKQLAAAYGLMENDSFTDPSVERFVPAVSTSLGEYTASKDLFDNVLKVFIDLGQMTDHDGNSISQIRADQWTSVARTLRAQGVQAIDALLALKIQTVLAGEVNGGESTPPSSIDIDLPDLKAQSDIEIQADNLRAMQAIYFAARLEDLKFFQVVDKLVERFLNGMLPLGKGNAGNTLYNYWKESVKRMTQTERRNLYSRTFGFLGGDVTINAPNREFNDLWLRFVSAVSSFARQVTAENLLRTNIPAPVSQQQVKKAARDLGANLSLHGYGIGVFAATDLERQIREIITLLSDPDIKTAYGARDMWQVIDQVANLELGGAKNSIRYRTMATSGAVIIRWLAEHAKVLVSAEQIIVLDVNQLRNLNSLRPRGVKPTVDPSDRDLVDACDQWLTVTGTAEKNVEDLSRSASKSPANRTAARSGGPDQ
jgi:hypothetical protein